MSPNTEGIGRPYSGNEKKALTINIRMEPKEVQSLDNMARELHTSRSGVIRKGLKLVEEMLSQK